MVHLADFNPHSREGSDSLISILDIRHVDFNPHSREGSDMEDRYHSLSESDFNPHSREGSDVLRCTFLIRCHYFNPHSREGSDITGVNTALTRKISIHTPAKGVTAHFHGCIFHILISSQYGADQKNFNPHSREGSDRSLSRMHLPYSDFNPHSREGSDAPEQPVFSKILQFQSTLPRRE